MGVRRRGADAIRGIHRREDGVKEENHRTPVQKGINAELGPGRHFVDTGQSDRGLVRGMLTYIIAAPKMNQIKANKHR